MPGPMFSSGVMTFTNPDGSIVSFSLLQGFIATDTDINAGTSYYGFIDTEGNWYIMRGVTAGVETHYDFDVGTSGYSTAWTARATDAASKYEDFNDKFPFI